MSEDCFCEIGYECLDCSRRRIHRREQVAAQIAAIEHTQHHHPTRVDIRTQLGEEPPERVDSPRDPDGLLEENRRERQWRWFE